MAKPTRLRFVGEIIETKDEEGNVIGRRPTQWLGAAPARDLDESDLAGLDAATLTMLLSPLADGSPPLYVDDSPKAAGKPAAEKGDA